MSENENKPTTTDTAASPAVAAFIPNLVTPNTERAVQDIIKNSYQLQQQQKQQEAPIKEENSSISSANKATNNDDNDETRDEKKADNTTTDPKQPTPTPVMTTTTIEVSAKAPPTTQPSGALVPTPTPTQTRIAAPPGDDNFENLQRAVQILGKAKQLDEMKRFDEALKLYRQGVDMLLEELIIRQGTEQSRSYLRDKCNDFMNRIDQLKLIIQIEKASADNKENQAGKVVNNQQS